ncbi:STAS domain-containing protein [Maritimibacter sp. UBA3975]|uniref:STAS domain-containing protein n=1 Tax=Maritimibacter sp. UBA3975 TaxID=1946833 RepID=UPI0025BCB76A|nr:STAS domain-containing protein [Maritimibacter sp. UBA3975]
MSATITLQPKLDLRAAGPLRDALLAHDAEDVQLDAGGVTHIGALSLQVIRAAARSWSEAGRSLTLINASNDLADQLSLLGFSTDTVTQWESRA